MNRRILGAVAVLATLAVTATAALACSTASLVGVPKCDKTTGVTTITWTALLGAPTDVPHWSAGILPGASLVGKGKGVFAVSTTTTEPSGFSGDVSESVYATNGQTTGNKLYATVHLDGGCMNHLPPPPHVLKPSARFNGPCGDPFYRAVFDNRRSNVSERFSFRYFSFNSMTYQHIRLTVKAHSKRVTRYVHVLGGSRLAVYAGHKGLIAHKRAAAPGNYRPC